MSPMRRGRLGMLNDMSGAWLRADIGSARAGRPFAVTPLVMGTGTLLREGAEESLRQCIGGSTYEYLPRGDTGKEMTETSCPEEQEQGTFRLGSVCPTIRWD